MKKHINKYLLILLSAILITACSDDENPFEGNNAHITSFALTVDGVKYPASISENNIIINVAQNINLSSASIEYTTSENASLQPDPKTITNWNEEQIFRVNAWNNEFESYKYIVKRTDIIDPNNVVLLTQADVNEFAKKEINEIKGNLIIGYTTVPSIAYDTIKDLTPLKTIRSVDLNIVINDACAGCNFEGLNNIRYAGGFYLGSLSKSSKANKALELELYNLRKINNLVINTDSLKSLSLPQLRSAGNIYINSNKLISLDISALENCSGDFVLKAIRKNKPTLINSNTSLRNINIAKLNSVGGTLKIENFWKVNKLDLPKLTSVNQDLQLLYIRSIPQIHLPELTTVNGLANINCNDGMTEFSAPKLSSVASIFISSFNNFSINLTKIDLASLKTVTKNLTIHNTSLTKLEFPKLNTIGDKFEMRLLPFVETISLPELTSCNEIELSATNSLQKFENPKMTDLNSLELLACNKLIELKMPAILNGDLTVNFGKKVSVLPNFNGLEEVKGVFMIKSCGSKILNIAGIKKLGSFKLSNSDEIESIKFIDLVETSLDFEISSLESLSNFSAPDLTRIGNNFTMKGCCVLTNINLPKLSSIKGQFKFYGARNKWQASKSTIENLDAFSALTTAGSVDIRYASKLNDYTGLKNVIGSLSKDDWSVQVCLYNPNYDNMLNGEYSNR